MQFIPFAVVLLTIWAGGAICEDTSITDLFDSLAEKGGVLETDDFALPTVEPTNEPTAEPTLEPTKKAGGGDKDKDKDKETEKDKDKGGDKDKDKDKEKDKGGNTGVDVDYLNKALNIKGSALETLDKLRKIKLSNGKPLTPYILFSIGTREGIDQRAKLPIFGEWMNDTINLQFQEKNPKRAYQLLTKVSSLLEIAYAGCYNFDCVIPVTTIQSEYQTLMYKAVRVSYDGIKTTVGVMKYLRAATRESTKGPKGQNKAKEILGMTIPWVDKLSEGYEQLEKDTDTLMNKADAAAIEATKNNLNLKREWEKWRKEVADTDAKMKANQAQDATYKNMVDLYMTKLKKIEQDRNTLAVEFVRLARTPVDKHQKCDTQVLQNYKTVTDYVKTTTTYNKGSNWIGQSKGQGVHTDTNAVTKAVRLSDTIKERCWIEKDKTHLEELEKKMLLINERINATRPGYLLLLKNLHETQRNRASMASMIAEAMVKKDQFTAAKGDHENAVNGLMTATTALKLTKTIFLESKLFWNDQKKFINNFLRAPNGATRIGENAVPINSGPVIAAIIGQKNTGIWRDKMIETGMYWIVFGRLSSIGYVTMQEAKKSINRVYVDRMDKESRQRVIANAGKVIDEIQKFQENLEKIERATKYEMDQALTAIYEKLGQDPKFERLVPLLTTARPPVTPKK